VERTKPVSQTESGGRRCGLSGTETGSWLGRTITTPMIGHTINMIRMKCREIIDTVEYQA
jgi:hypothetical protein